MTQPRMFDDVPLRVEVNWGKRTFEGTLHPLADVTDDVLGLTISESTRWEPGQPYPSFFGARGSIAFESPDGEYSPSVTPPVLPQFTTAQLTATSAIRVSYRDREGDGFASEWTVYWTGLLTNLRQQGGEQAIGQLREINRAFLDERIATSDLDSDLFEGEAVGTMIIDAELGGRDYPVATDYLLGEVSYNGSRRAFVNATALWMAAWPYANTEGDVRFFEPLTYEGGSRTPDFEIGPGQVAPIEAEVVTAVDAIATRVPFDFGGDPPPPASGAYGITIANEEWVIPPGGSIERTYTFPVGDTYEARPDYGPAQLVNAGGKIAGPFNAADFPLSYPLASFTSALGYGAPTESATFARVQVASQPDVRVAHPLESEIAADLRFTVTPVGMTGVTINVRNVPSGANRILWAWHGMQRQTRSVVVGSRVVDRSFTVNVQSTYLGVDFGWSSPNITQWRAAEATATARLTALGAFNTRLTRLGVGGGFTRPSVRANYQVREAIYGNREVTVEDDYEKTAAARFEYRFNLPVAVRSTADPTQSGRRYVLAPAAARDEYGIIDANPPPWYDHENDQVAAAEALATLLSQPRKLISLLLPVNYLEGSMFMPIALRPGQAGHFVIQDTLTGRGFEGDGFILGRTLTLVNGQSPTIRFRLVELLTDRLPAPSVTRVSNSALDVSWDAVTGATDYDLRYRPSGGAWVTLTSQITTGRTRRLTGLAADTSYEVQYRATVGGTASGWSLTGYGTTSTEAPVVTAPGAVRSLADTPGNGQLALAWVAPSSGSAPTSYTVEWGTSTSYGSSATSVGRSHTITGLTNGTLIYYRVRATNSAGNGPWATGSGTPVIPVVLAPPAPTGLSATDGDGESVVTWQASARAVDYNVRWRVDGSGGAWDDATVTGTTYTITGLTNGVTYEIEVRAQNTGGDSAYVATTASPAEPAAGPVLTFVRRFGSNLFVTLSWTWGGDNPNTWHIQNRRPGTTAWNTRGTIAGSGRQGSYNMGSRTGDWEISIIGGNREGSVLTTPRSNVVSTTGQAGGSGALAITLDEALLEIEGTPITLRNEEP